MNDDSEQPRMPPEATDPPPQVTGTSPEHRPTAIDRALNLIERLGNMLPDPAVLFLILMLIVWGASAALSPIEFTEIHPVTQEPIRIQNQLTGDSLADFLANMVATFVGFHPLGVVLVALLGVGVAEHTGFINAGLKALLGITSRSLLTPMLILVAIVSHTAADAGYVLVIPLGGVIFHAAGRHPLAGIAAAFAGVSGGFSANFIPSGIDPLLQGLTQAGAQVIDADRLVNPLCNWYFTAASSALIIVLGWFLTDRVIEPRLAMTKIDGDLSDLQPMESLGPREWRGLVAALVAMVGSLVVLGVLSFPADSPLRSPEGGLTDAKARLMQSIVPLIFLLFLVPGVVYGYAAGTVENHRDIIKGMSKSMAAMGYYIVLAFFASLFIKAFNDSNIGALMALKGADGLRALKLPPQVTIVGIILLTGAVNLLVGSASAKWALLSPIFVPMLMQLGISPELTQAAYRVGDSTTNIITPLMPYFPLVVVYCQRYVRGTGIGTLVSLMLPYSVVFLVVWTIFLVLYWMLGIPMGLDAPYQYP
ncbi:AbgT family transporter [Tautonia marina]|uniref:AbgT family transporter n=1 Tax=Tautonia marina TaxID=2653855 RepID=UPI001260B8CA|nr:AbgT family transporter [Tautonia marina]